MEHTDEIVRDGILHLCRERTASGLPTWYLVPDGIVQYISKRGLYIQGPDDKEIHGGD